MDPVLLRAWLPLTPDVVEVALAACVSASAVFLPASWIVEGHSVGTGARVTVEIGSEGTGVIARFAGVVGWRTRAGAADDDAGIGIFVGVVVDELSSALLNRLARRAGAGGRVLPPGGEDARAARAINAALVEDTVADAASSGLPVVAPAAVGSRRFGLLADLPPPPNDDDSNVVLPSTALSPAWADRVALLAAALNHSDGNDADATLAAEGFDGLELERTQSGAVELPFGQLLLDGGSDVDAFPDAPPPADDDPRPFEAQSTDVDLLRVISAADLAVAAVGNEPSMFVIAPTGVDDDSDSDADDDSDEGDLPSMEAELISDWEGDTPRGGLQATVTTAWIEAPSRVPSPSPWPPDPTLPLVLVGASWSMSRRGQLGVEALSWPAQGTRRASGMAEPLDGHDDDADVFGPPPGPPSVDEVTNVGPAPPPDPFAPQTTDPGLNVEGLVARHVRESHNDVFAADIDVDFDAGPRAAGLVHRAFADDVAFADDSAFADGRFGDDSAFDDDSAFADRLGDDRLGDDPEATSDELLLPKLPVSLLGETPVHGHPRPPPELRGSSSEKVSHDRSSDDGTPL